MSDLGRLFQTLLGLSKKRIPRQLELLGAPAEAVAAARGKPDAEQEEVLSRFVEGKHAVMLDWRAERDQVYEELLPILPADERSLLPPKKEVPEEKSSAIARIRGALSSSKRALVHTESFGDFSFLFLVPREKEAAFIECVGPWLIKDEEA